MMKLYFAPAPNPLKVALALEELEIPYQAVPVDVRKGEQFRPEFVALNPNAKTPVLEDDGVAIFDSNAILLYLAEKTGRFLPPPGASNRADLLSWLMFVATGIGPYSGQAVHFRHYAPEPKEYAVKRYTYEAERHWGILESRLSSREFMVGGTYTIVDMAVWGWARALPFVLGEDVWTKKPHLKRHLDQISARPAAARAGAIKDRFTFKQENDEESRLHMFPHLRTA